MQKTELIKTLRELDIKPNRLKGQNFLVQTDIIPRMIAAANLRAGETVVEIGPGLGVLTKELLGAGARVIAIEQERQFGEYLRKFFKGSPLSVLIGNAVLRIPELELPEDYKVVSNLPYAITSPVVNLFLTRASVRPSKMVLMVQKEVAERLVASPGNKERGILTVLIEFLGAARIIETVEPSAFYPPPKVDSAVIEIVVGRSKKEMPMPEVDRIIKIVKFGFSKRRAQLKNVFKKWKGIPRLSRQGGIARDDKETSGISFLEKTGIDVTLRAEDLTADEWRRLAQQDNGI